MSLVGRAGAWRKHVLGGCAPVPVFGQARHPLHVNTPSLCVQVERAQVGVREAGLEGLVLGGNYVCGEWERVQLTSCG